MALTDTERDFLAGARRAVLATTTADGRARLVPICFVLEGRDEQGLTLAWSPLDEKPKATPDIRDLARVRDIVVQPRVTILADRWSEDWSRLGWVRCTGTASVVEPAALGRPTVDRLSAALRAKHPQYRRQRLEDRPLIRIAIDRWASWGDLSVDPPGSRSPR